MKGRDFGTVGKESEGLRGGARSPEVAFLDSDGRSHGPRIFQKLEIFKTIGEPRSKSQSHRRDGTETTTGKDRTQRHD